MENDLDPDRHDSGQQQRITARAFARFEARGGLHGYDVEDWLEAEREEADAVAQLQTEAATPPPGLPPSAASGNSARDEESRRDAERAARAINRDAQRQLVR
ncbi:MAG: DUF2934 domain-containing protein [Acidobacteriota bacterium]